MGAFSNKKIHPAFNGKSPKGNGIFITNKPKTNGWTLPLHPLQIVAFSSFFIFAGIFFGLIVPFIPSTFLRWSACIFSLILFVLHFMVHMINISVDPADLNVIQKYKKANAHLQPSVKQFDRSKHNHVIENQFCYICEVHVNSKAKHCSVCNKCISEFDHHCKWLNNCVGGRNYRLFISCVITALLGASVVLASTVAFVFAYFDESSWLYGSSESETRSNTTFTEHANRFSLLPQSLQTLWISVILFSLVLSSVVFLLLFHLLCFHIFLNCIGLSTYEFIVRRRRKEQIQDQKTNLANSSPPSTNLSRRLRNLRALSFVIQVSNQLHDTPRTVLKSSSEPQISLIPLNGLSGPQV